jgi:hypothetical protein
LNVFLHHCVLKRLAVLLCFGSGSGWPPDSLRSLVPDVDPEPNPGRQSNPQKGKK